MAGRQALGAVPYRALVADIDARCRGRCEYPPCRKAGSLDAAHFPKRSQGGSDDVDHVLRLCRTHHEQADNARADRRLVVTPLGAERFLFYDMPTQAAWDYTRGREGRRVRDGLEYIMVVLDGLATLPEALAARARGRVRLGSGILAR